LLSLAKHFAFIAKRIFEAKCRDALNKMLRRRGAGLVNWWNGERGQAKTMRPKLNEKEEDEDEDEDERKTKLKRRTQKHRNRLAINGQ
jgi:hypothetical protein